MTALQFYFHQLRTELLKDDARSPTHAKIEIFCDEAKSHKAGPFTQKGHSINVQKTQTTKKDRWEVSSMRQSNSVLSAPPRRDSVLSPPQRVNRSAHLRHTRATFNNMLEAPSPTGLKTSSDHVSASAVPRQRYGKRRSHGDKALAHRTTQMSTKSSRFLAMARNVVENEDTLTPIRGPRDLFASSRAASDTNLVLPKRTYSPIADDSSLTPIRGPGDLFASSRAASETNLVLPTRTYSPTTDDSPISSKSPLKTRNSVWPQQVHGSQEREIEKLGATPLSVTRTIPMSVERSMFALGALAVKPPYSK